MALNPVSHQFLRGVEAVTGFPVHVEVDDRLRAPLLARIQIARGGIPIHRVSYQQARQFDPHGTVGERAELGLNRLAGESLPRNADGVDPEALAARIAALKRLRSLAR